MKQDAVKDEFDAVSSHYGRSVDDALKFTGTSGSYFIKVKANYLLDIANKHFNEISGLKVLDLGCGVGNFHSYLNHSFQHVCGADISDASIKLAKQFYKQSEFRVYDGQNLPYADQEFDIVFSSCVLHHVPLDNRERFAANASRVLKSGGIFAVFEHNTYNPLTRKVINDCAFDDDAIMLSVKELKALMDNQGFEEIKEKYILTVPSFNLTTRKIDQALSGLRLGAQYYVTGTKV